MPRTYRLFISHSWAYGDAYDKVTKMIQNQGINYFDHSVPRHDPIHTNGTDRELKAAIDAKIKGTSCVLIMTGMYSNYSKWINKEIEMAKSYGKPIIAIEPWGAERTSRIVKDNADAVVGWNGSSIANAIRIWGL